MKRTVVTAENMTSAHSRGETELTVPYSAVVTPSARDTASSLGITLRREAPDGKTGRDASRAGTGPAVPGPRTSGQSLRAEPARGKEANTQEPPGFTPKLFDDVKRRVLARLPTSLHAHPLLDELLRKSLLLLCERGRNPAPAKGAGGTPAANSRTTHGITSGTNGARPAMAEMSAIPGAPGQTAATAAPGADGAPIVSPASSGVAAPETAWKTSAGGALLVKASALPWQRSALGDAVNVIDVMGGPSPFEAGYMEWDASSFAWTLERDELFTVLDGTLRVRVGGETLNAGPGDMMYLPRGTEAEFSSPGHVKAAYSACAPSCSGDSAHSGVAARHSDAAGPGNAARPGGTAHFSNTRG